MKYASKIMAAVKASSPKIEAYWPRCLPHQTHGSSCSGIPHEHSPFLGGRSCDGGAGINTIIALQLLRPNESRGDEENDL
jgi:hypothetical protein